MTRLFSALLALHCAWFAAMHVAWGFGWRWGIPTQMASVNARPWFLAYDVAAAVAMLGLAALALALLLRRERLRRTWSRAVLVAAALVCGIRGLPGILGDGVAAMKGRLTAVSVLADAWFVVTAVLCGLLAWRSRLLRRP